MFGFPLRVGTVRLGALNLYRDRPGPLSGDQHADALVMADVAARWVLQAQAGAPPDMVAEELEDGADFHFVVHNAAGMVAVQLGVSVSEALIRLRAYAFSQRPAARRGGRGRRGPHGCGSMTPLVRRAGVGAGAGVGWMRRPGSSGCPRLRAAGALEGVR